MRRRFCCSFLFTSTLVAAASAQSYITSPPNYLSTSASGTAVYFGGDSFGRVMFFDGEVGNAPMVVKEVAYRPEGHSTGGRTWTRVSLSISHCDVANVTTTFASNPTSAPVRVFRSSMTWPAFPRSGWSIRFPFSSPWVFNGTEDICLDYDFSGGTIIGQPVPWWKLHPEQYDLDGFDVRDHIEPRANTFGSNPGCRDTNGYGNLLFLRLAVFGPTSWQTAARNNFLFEARTLTAPGASNILVAGQSGSPVGSAFPGVTCERVFLDLSQPLVFFSGVAASSGYTTFWLSNTPYVPYNPAIAGTTIWAQGAWNDTANGLLRFTRGAENTVPRLPTVYRRKVLAQPDNVLKATRGDWPRAFSYPTVVRYAK